MKTIPIFVFVLLIVLHKSYAQLYFHPGSISHHLRAESRSLPLSLGAHQYAHPSVIANAIKESELSPELLKSNRFYSNPHIADALAKESLLTDKEMPVIDREAEKIPRDMIFKLFRNAGWINRR